MRILSAADSAFVGVKPAPGLVYLGARGEAVDVDKYDKNGKLNPFHGWTLDFPEHVDHADRTYSNKHMARGWYDDPENKPGFNSSWGGSGDYSDKHFYDSTAGASRETDPNREEHIDPTGALGQYQVGAEDLNEYHPQGHHLRPTNQTGYPSNFDDSHRTETRGIYSDRPDLNPWEDLQHEPAPRVRAPQSGGYTTPREREATILPEDHDHGVHDRLNEPERVFGVWHGGGSYSHGREDENMESFPSLEHAMDTVENRYANYGGSRGGERATYHRPTDTFHLTGDTASSNLSTPAVDNSSYMDIYHGRPSTDGWEISHHAGPDSRVWLNGNGEAQHGTVDQHHADNDHDDDDEYGSHPFNDNTYAEDDDEPRNSHPVQQDILNANFGHHPDEDYGDKYKQTDHFGHHHTIRAPNPRYGAMDKWHYDFTPHSVGDRDPNARDASRDGPQPLSFGADTAEGAFNLYKNLHSDLSSLADRGWGVHKVTVPQSARDGHEPGIHIEAHRRNANDDGYDRVIKHGSTWALHHVPDPTPDNRFPPVTSGITSTVRKDVLDYADGVGRSE